MLNKYFFFLFKRHMTMLFEELDKIKEEFESEANENQQIEEINIDQEDTVVEKIEN